MIPTHLRTAWRNVVRQANRSRAALTAVTFGVVSMILAAGFIDWNLRFGRDNTIYSQLGHLQVMRPGFLDFGRSDPYGYLLEPLSTDEQEALKALPGFRVAAPRLQFVGLASSGELTISFIGEGVDPGAETTLSAALRFPSGRNLEPGDRDAVIVGRGLAENLGIAVGAPLVLIATTESGGINAVEAEVVGHFESIAKAYDDNALRIPIELARSLLRTPGEHLRLVLLDRTEDTEAAYDQLRSALPATKYEIVPWRDLADFYTKSEALYSKQVGFIYVVIAVLIVLAISNTMTMMVMERVGEIGTMMALGSRRKEVRTIFLLEGFILGAIGAAFGCALGVVLAIMISAIGIPMPPGPIMSWPYEAGILLTADNIIEAASIALITTIVASIYPAWKASRLEIVDALRTRQ